MVKKRKRRVRGGAWRHKRKKKRPLPKVEEAIKIYVNETSQQVKNLSEKPSWERRVYKYILLHSTAAAPGLQNLHRSAWIEALMHVFGANVQWNKVLTPFTCSYVDREVIRSVVRGVLWRDPSEEETQGILKRRDAVLLPLLKNNALTNSLRCITDLRTMVVRLKEKFRWSFCWMSKSPRYLMNAELDTLNLRNVMTNVCCGDEANVDSRPYDMLYKGAGSRCHCLQHHLISVVTSPLDGLDCLMAGILPIVLAPMNPRTRISFNGPHFWVSGTKELENLLSDYTMLNCPPRDRLGVGSSVICVDKQGLARNGKVHDILVKDPNPVVVGVSGILYKRKLFELWREKPVGQFLHKTAVQEVKGSH